MSLALKHSPLHAQHQMLGAKLVDFGGWEMPIAYPSGTISEHEACRRNAVVFDVSHLGTVRMSGAAAFDRLQASLTNDLEKIGPGRAQYTHLLDDAGAVVDDIIVWWINDLDFDVMPNASNTSNVTSVIGGTDVTSTRAILAVQGPNARSLVAKVIPAAAEVPHFAVQRLQWNDVDLVVAGTGYTGEDGIEIAVPTDRAPELWQVLLDVGVVPAGLGARDTLRLEAALPLHGNELGAGITPLQAGLSWVVAWNKPDFRGRAALDAMRANGLPNRLRGIVTAGRQPPRAHSLVFVGDREVGHVSSGNFSPMLGHGIALAFLSPDVVVGEEVEIDIRGRRLPGTVTKTPFVRKAN